MTNAEAMLLAPQNGATNTTFQIRGRSCFDRRLFRFDSLPSCFNAM